MLAAFSMAAVGIDFVQPAAARDAPAPVRGALTGGYNPPALVPAAPIPGAAALSLFDRLGQGGHGPAAAAAQPAPAPLSKPLVVARAAPADPPPVVEKPLAARAAAATARLDSVDYDLAAVRAAARPVPRLYLDALPRNLANASSTDAKKRLFIQAVLPVILRVNEEITAARWRAERLGDRLIWADALTRADQEWLISVAEHHGTAPFDVPSLLKRLDIVPPSLALAQAAEESGWGTSRFAQEGNALFGQYTYESATGMVPTQRDPDRRHRVNRYDNLLEAAHAYARNLNSHPAYEDFRHRRSRLRRADRPISGYDLAGELQRYSERGEVYIATIRQIIRQNRLGDFDRALLNDRQWTAVAGLPDPWSI